MFFFFPFTHDWVNRNPCLRPPPPNRENPSWAGAASVPLIQGKTLSFQPRWPLRWWRWLYPLTWTSERRSAWWGVARSSRTSSVHWRSWVMQSRCPGWTHPRGTDWSWGPSDGFCDGIKVWCHCGGIPLQKRGQRNKIKLHLHVLQVCRTVHYSNLSYQSQPSV